MLELNFDTKNLNKDKIKTIKDSTVYVNKAKNYLVRFHSLIM